MLHDRQKHACPRRAADSVSSTTLPPRASHGPPSLAAPVPPPAPRSGGSRIPLNLMSWSLTPAENEAPISSRIRIRRWLEHLEAVQEQSWQGAVGPAGRSCLFAAGQRQEKPRGAANSGKKAIKPGSHTARPIPHPAEGRGHQGDPGIFGHGSSR